MAQSSRRLLPPASGPRPGAPSRPKGGRVRGGGTGELQALLSRIHRRKARQRARLALLQPADSAPPAGPAPAQGASAGGRTLAVESLTWLTPDLVQLRLSRPEGFDYRAGQYVKLELGGAARSYSLVSSPHEPFLEVFIERVPGGRFSAALEGLKTGDVLHLASGPKGSFTLDPGYSAHLMVATVTGIGPFVGMLRWAARQGPPAQRFLVLQGASYQDELGYADELEALAGRHPDRVAYVPTVSRPAEPRNQGWRGETGRVHEVALREAEARGLDPARTLVYACGQPGMVDEAEAGFRRLGFAVKTESY